MTTRTCDMCGKMLRCSTPEKPHFWMRGKKTFIGVEFESLQNDYFKYDLCYDCAANIRYIIEHNVADAREG